MKRGVCEQRFANPAPRRVFVVGPGRHEARARARPSLRTQATAGGPQVRGPAAPA